MAAVTGDIKPRVWDYAGLDLRRGKKGHPGRGTRKAAKSLRRVGRVAQAWAGSGSRGLGTSG